MKKVLYHILLPVMLLQLGSALIAQSPFDAAHAQAAARIREEVALFTDRVLYVVNDTVHFFAAYREEHADSDSWSAVLYTELIAPSGESVARVKSTIGEGGFTGQLVLPSSLATGRYTMKAYTRWMRNRGPESFSYCPLDIVNPFRSELASGKSGMEVESAWERIPLDGDVCNLVLNAGDYGPGDEVALELSLPGHLRFSALAACLSVVEAGLGDTLLGPLRPGDAALPFELRYLPDRKGPSISGSVVDPQGDPVSFASVHFSSLGEQADYFATVSDESGRFVVPFSGTKGSLELFVAPVSGERTDLEVRIDQDFDSRALPFGAGGFVLEGERREQAAQMAVRMQLARAFEGEGIQGDRAVRVDSIPFYGSRVHRVSLDDYVTLPSMEEVFINLVPDVFVLHRRNKSTLRIQSENTAIEIYPPLVLIDHIPIFDHRAVMALDPEKIHIVDVIPEVYIKGNVTYGGILSITSRKGDVAGIDLAEGAYFFDFLSVSETDASLAPVYHEGDRVPDLRSTQYWKGDLILRRGEQQRLHFAAPVSPGRYTVTVRGMDPAGQCWGTSQSFTVSD